MMRIPKCCLLFAPLFLAGCAASSTPQTTSVQTSVSPSPIVSLEAKPPEPTPSIDPFELYGAVGLDNIEPKLIAKQSKLTIQFKTQSSRDCKLTMQYPYISGLADTTLQGQLNDNLRQDLMVKMNAPETMLDGDRCRRSVSRKPREFYTRTIGCVVHFAEESLVSISCSNSTSPGAYPQPKEHSVTFDLVTGRIYQLVDLFKPDSNYMVRLAVVMRDAWWEMGPGYISFPLDSLETQHSFDFYLQARCDEARHPWVTSPLGSFPEVCMVIPNLGSGASRNAKMHVRLGGIKDKLDTSGALKVLVDKID